MFHTSATGTAPNVQDKCVPLERCSFHEPYFILANAFQILFHEFLFPIVAMDHNRHSRGHSSQVEFLKTPYLDRTVSKGIETRTLDDAETIAPTLRADQGGCRCQAPFQGHISETHSIGFGAAIWNEEQDHRRINESVFAIELGRKRSNFIPIRRIPNRD